MFKIDEYIIYGTNGVCKVNSIGTLDIGGIDKNRLFYTLEPVYSKGSAVYTPVDSTKVIMRKIVTKEEALELIDDIPNIETIPASNDRFQEDGYRAAMKKHDCREWVKIIKTLYLRKQERILNGKKFTSTDERYMGLAENGLYGELAVALNISKQDVEEYIVKRIGSENFAGRI